VGTRQRHHSTSCRRNAPEKVDDKEGRMDVLNKL